MKCCGPAVPVLPTEYSDALSYQEQIAKIWKYITSIQFPSFEPEANVKDFGAKGDGVTDDTVAFERAFAHYKAVFVPVGNYKLTKLDLTGKTLVGENSGRLYASRTEVPASNIIVNKITAWHTTVTDINFMPNLNDFSAKEHTLITPESDSQIFSLFMRCGFFGYKYVINYAGVVTFAFCDISQCETGIFGLIDSMVYGSYIHSCDLGIYLGAGCNANNISNNKIEWNGTGVNCENNGANIITNNVVDRNNAIGIRYSGCTGYVSTGNISVRNQYYNYSYNNIKTFTINDQSHTSSSTDDGTGAVWPTYAHTQFNGGNNNMITLTMTDDSLNPYDSQATMTNTQVTSNRQTPLITSFYGKYSAYWGTSITAGVPLGIAGVFGWWVNDTSHNYKAYIQKESESSPLAVIHSTFPTTPTATYQDGILTVTVADAALLTLTPY